MTEDFDYGDRLDDGQYENYPTIPEDKPLEQRVMYAYIHEECGEKTVMSDRLAESVARDPEYYTRTFCTGCGGHVLVEEVTWTDGEDWVRS